MLVGVVTFCAMPTGDAKRFDPLQGQPIGSTSERYPLQKQLNNIIITLSKGMERKTERVRECRGRGGDVFISRFFGSPSPFVIVSVIK
jgi:hypothetical protein